MTNDVVLDSSILVEYSKGHKTDLLEALIDQQYNLHISSIVLSEFVYQWIGYKGGKAPRTLQGNQAIPAVLATYDPLPFLSQFTILPATDQLTGVYLYLMQRYNLLPNDALIIATAKCHTISAVASYDPDFENACTGEGIRLFRTIADLA